MHQVDDVVMVRELCVDLQLLGVVIGSVGSGTGGLLYSLRLGDALDGDVLTSESVLGPEDQAE